MSLSEPPPRDLMIPMRRPSRALAGVAVAAGFGLLVLGAIGVKNAVFTARAPGSLVTTVFAAQGDAVSGAKVYVDGKLRCDSSPCRVEHLAPGSHLVKASAPGYVETAVRAVSIHSGRNSAMRLEISAVPSAEKPSAPVADNSASDSTKSPEDSPAVDTKSLPKAPPVAAAPRHWHPARHFTRPKVASQARRPAPAPAPAVHRGAGIMLLTSSPASNVVVDGRPIGSTPKAVRVASGVHTVVFAGANRRVVRSIRVGPGSRQTVSAML